MVNTVFIVLLVLGVGGLIESLFSLSFPKLATKICRSMGFMRFCKNPKKVKQIAIWELVIAIILLLIAINL